MARCFAFLLFVSLFAARCKAQVDSSRFLLSLKAGFGSSYFSELPVYRQMEYSSGNTSSAVLAFGFQKRLEHYLVVGLDLAYTYRGSGFSKVNDSVVAYGVWYVNGQPQDNGPPVHYQNHKIRSLDVPIYVRIGLFNKKFTPYITAGFLPSFTVQYNYQWNFWLPDGVQERRKDINDQTNKFTFGYMAGAGLKFRAVGLELRYSYYHRTDILALGQKFSPSNYAWWLVLSFEPKL